MRLNKKRTADLIFQVGSSLGIIILSCAEGSLQKKLGNYAGAICSHINVVLEVVKFICVSITSTVSVYGTK